MNELWLQHLDLIAAAPDGVKRLRELILELAVRGKLVPQDPTDEPASELLKRIQAEKARLVAEGKVKKDKPLPAIGEQEKPFELPVGWEWCRLGAIALQITDGTHHTPQYLPSGVAFISVKDIDGNTVSFDDCKYISDESHRQINTRCNPERGDILLCRIGTLGRPTLVNTDRPFSLFVSVGLLKLPKTVSIAVYLHDVMRSPLLTTQYNEIKAGGSHTNKLNLGDIPNLKIPLPPLPEQHRIVAKVDELMALCDQLEARETEGGKAHATLVKTLLDTLITPSQASGGTGASRPDRFPKPVRSDSAPERMDGDFTGHWERITRHFDTLFTTEASIDALKQTILQLAVLGKLVPQNPSDEPASELLKRIQAEKARLVAEGKIKKDKPLPAIAEDEKPFELPVGWEWSRLQSSFDVRDGTHDTPKYQPSGFPLVTSKNIYGGRLCLDDVKFISEADHRQISERSGVDRGDILFAMIGSIGNPVVVDIDNEFSIKNVALFKYYDRSLSSPEYLRIYLAVIADEMKAKSAGGVQSFVSLGFIRSYPIPLPPLPEQHRIVAKVDELMALCDQLADRLKAARERSGQYATAATRSALEAA